MRATIIKARQDERQDSNVKAEDSFTGRYTEDILEPSYTPSYLAKVIENSNIMPQCVDTMSQNCDGFGYTFVEAINETDRSDRISAVMESELAFLKNFFNYANYEMSFTDLRKRLRVDIESCGNGFMEVVKNMRGEYDGFSHVPALDVRLCKLSDKKIEFNVKRRVVGGYDFEDIPFRKRFRNFVQLINGDEKVYFKEFRDPRDINAATGKEVTDKDREDAEKYGKEIVLATEIVWFNRYSLGSLYGLPRWVGCTPEILGSRAVAEDNLDFFENAIPSKIVKVAGMLAKKTHKSIKEFISNNRRRGGGRNRMLLLEAETNSQVGQKMGSAPSIDIVDMKARDEASHLKYDQDNRDKIRSSFRFSQLYIGLEKDFNTATAKVAKVTAEQQVFGPEKKSFDFFINQFILPELNIKYYIFESKSVPLEDRTELADLIKKLSDVGLTAGEARKLADKLADIELDDIDPEEEGNEWMNVPLKIAQYVMAMAARQSAAPAATPPEEKEESKKKVDSFIKGLTLLAQELRREV